MAPGRRPRDEEFNREEAEATELGNPDSNLTLKVEGLGVKGGLGELVGPA